MVYCWGVDESPIYSEGLEAEALRVCGSALYLVQALLKAELSPALWFVTQGAQAVGSEASLALLPSTLWGLGKVIALEHPEFGCRMVDLAPDGEPLALRELCAELLSPAAAKSHLAFRGGQAYAPRLVRRQIRRQAAPLYLEVDVSYLITGGLGGTGLLVARWMVEHGAKHLVLVGRRAASEVPQETRQQVQALEQAGAKVVMARADVSKIEQMDNVLVEIEQSGPPLRGIIHCAGVFEDRLLANHQWDLFANVFAPKVIGAWNLHLLTEDKPLDFFVLFSSVASLLGASGLSNYTAANAFLDALAHHRQRQGLAGLSINWGPWRRVGMAEAVGRQREAQWLVQGMEPMNPDEALALLSSLLQQEAAQVGVMQVDWAKFSTFSAASTFVEALMPVSGTSEEQEQRVALLPQLAAASAKQRKALLLAFVRSEVATVLGLTPAQGDSLSLSEGFFELGMDSLMSIELRNRLQIALNSTLPSTLIFKYPTLSALVDYLLRDVLIMPAPEAAQDSQLEAESEAANNEQQAEVLAEVEQLSEEELEALIDEEFDLFFND